MKGFTLIEILISLSILVLVFLAIIPFGVQSYFRFMINFESQRIIENLRFWQFMAMTQKNDSSFGAYFLPRKIIFFQGSSFENRDPKYDEEIKIPSFLKISPSLNEIVFLKLEGRPKEPFSILIEAGSQKREIEGSSFGIIDFKQ
jgi:prepilin-type N-terminal cleavage/methylation domain-containing protein